MFPFPFFLLSPTSLLLPPLQLVAILVKLPSRSERRAQREADAGDRRKGTASSKGGSGRGMESDLVLDLSILLSKGDVYIYIYFIILPYNPTWQLVEFLF